MSAELEKTASWAFAGFANLASLAANLYLIGFLGDFVVPRTVDAGPATSPAVAIAVNLGLILLFGLQHSVMARKGFKKRWTRIVPEHLERSAYVLAASLALALLFWGWRPLPEVVWSLSGPWDAVAWAVFALGWVLAVAATLLIDPNGLSGLRQVEARYADERSEPVPFQTPGPYRHVRHPLYLGLLLAFWATPEMTIGHLLFAAGATVYILAGIRYEERDLLRRFGDDYARYRERVPMLFPR